MTVKRFSMTASVATDEHGINVWFRDNEAPTNQPPTMHQGEAITFASVEAFEVFKTMIRRGGFEVELR